MHDAPQLEQKFRMPTVFGPSPGPRNVPRDHQRHRYANHRTAVSVSAHTDAKLLSRYLPPGCRLEGDAVVNVTMSCLTQLGWLAGRGYNIVAVRFPNVAFDGKDGTIQASLGAVIWESLADPIITGREEVAMPKVYAEIPNPVVLGDSYACSASWQGFRFFDLNLSGAAEATAPRGGERQPQLLYKHIPKTGQLLDSDVGYMTVSGPVPTEPPVTVHRYLAGRGSFGFTAARWEDMPTQYTIVNALAALPLGDFFDASVMITSQGDVDSLGGGIVSGQHPVR